MTNRRGVIIFFIGCSILGIVLGVIIAYKKGVTLPNYQELITTFTPEEPKPVRLIFAGDMMLDRGVEQSVKNTMGGDFGKLFEHVSEYFKTADAVIVNLEGPVTDVGADVGSKYSFQMNPSLIPALITHNIKLVSFANNHAGDRSLEGFIKTLEHLTKSGIAYTGAGSTKTLAESVTILDIHNQKIGFIGCSDVGPAWIEATATTPGIVLCNDARLSEIITTAKSKVDFLVVTPHWGNEYVARTDRQQTIAHKAIDAGADMIIGHHPHVVQETEWYNNKFIAYSLGNFIFDQYFSPETMRGLLVEVTIDQGTAQSIILKTVELDPKKNKYQPYLIRDTLPSDFLVKKSTPTPTCPRGRDNDIDLWLAPVGPSFGISTQYIPRNLVLLKNYAPTSSEGMCLNASAAKRLQEMLAVMRQEDLRVIITSAFRSADYQTHLHDNSESTRDPVTNPFPSVAIPGRSEHQLGMAIDMVALPTYKLADFKNTPEYAWLSENAWRYGFIQSYPAGKESITGYIAEPWHWRYVGLEHAQNIYEQQTTVYEYLQNLAKQQE